MTLLVVLATLGLASRGWAANGDELFKKKQYAEAVKEYEKQLPNSSDSERLRIQFQIVESESMQFRFENALKRLRSIPPRATVQDEANYRLLFVTVAGQYLSRYQGSLEEEAEKLKKELDEVFWSLFVTRNDLVNLSLGSQPLFDTAKKDLERIPTYWDYAVVKWTERIQQSAQEDDRLLTPEQANALAKVDYELSPQRSLSSTLLTASLYEESSRLEGVNRQTAKELWKLARVGLAGTFTGEAETSTKEVGEAQRNHRLFMRKTLEQLSQVFTSKRAKAHAWYEVASLSSGLKEYQAAIDWCKKVPEDSLAANPCYTLRSQIELPSLNLKVRQNWGAKETRLRVTTKNLKNFHLRVYPTDVSGLESMYLPAERSDWWPLRRLDNHRLLMFAGRPSPTYAFTVPNFKPYEEVEAEYTLPVLSKGLYVVVASNEKEFPLSGALLEGAVLNISDLVLFGSSGLLEPKSYNTPKELVGQTYPAHHFYLLDRTTGNPVGGAEFIMYSRTDWKKSVRLETTFNQVGQVQIPVTITNQGISSSQDGLAKRGNEVAVLSRPANFYFGLPSTHEIHADFDRAIYRPGQKVSFRITTMARRSDGWRSAGKLSLEVQVNDPNGKKVVTQTLKTDEWGTAASSFTIPQGLMLGNYFLNVTTTPLKDRITHAESFRVEEYKRPNVEVKVDTEKSNCRFGAACAVNGSAKFYFGGAMANATVKYEIRELVWWPWWCGMRAGHMSGKLIARSEVQTDKQGGFKFEFAPSLPKGGAKNSPAMRYEIKAEVLEPGGRPISATGDVMVSREPVGYEIALPRGYWYADEKPTIEVMARNLERKNTASDYRWAIYRLNDAKQLTDLFLSERVFSEEAEASLSNVTNGDEVAKGKGRNEEKKGGVINVPALEPGLYRLSVFNKQSEASSEGQSVSFVVLNRQSKAKIAGDVPLLFSSHQKAEVGDSVSFFLGSEKGNRTVFLELWVGDTILKKQSLPGKQQEYRVTVDSRMRGGFSLHVFGTWEGAVTSQRIYVEVPWTDRNLKVAAQTKKTYRPGEQAEWHFAMESVKGQPIKGEGMLTVSDRSLDYYVPGGGGHWVAGLYPAIRPIFNLLATATTAESNRIYPDARTFNEKFLGKMPTGAKPLSPPRLRVENNTLHSYGVHAEMREALTSMPMSAMAGRAQEKGFMADADANARKAEGGAAAPATAEGPRNNFAETAAFLPKLRITEGHLAASFRFPDSLTSWKARLVALTSEGQWGSWEAEVVTKKEVMVSSVLPRFLREKDEATLSFTVHNESKQLLKGPIKISVTSQGKDLTSLLKWSEGNSVDLKPGQKITRLATFNVPSGEKQFRVEAKFGSGPLSDGESREIPVLPAVTRMIASQFVVLDGDDKKHVDLPSFDEKAGDKLESLWVQLEPQLLGTVVASLPALIQCPCESTDMIAKQFVPISIMGKLFAKYPEMKSVAKKLKPQKTLLPAWEENDPRRLLSLNETPWVNQAQGETVDVPLISLLNPERVEKQHDRALDRLRERQQGNGGFPWFAGGESDLFITMHVLESFSEALRFGVEVPEEMIRRAYQYVMTETYGDREAWDPGSATRKLFVSYVLSTYFERFSWAKASGAQIKAWMEQLEEHVDAFTPFGKAYASWIWHSLGDDKRSDAYLDQAMSGMKSDPLTGNYWAPEEKSWVWYQDSVQKHTLFLRLLASRRPSDKRIGGLVQWLLFNRKGNVWKSPQESVAALYALLETNQGLGKKGDDRVLHTAWDNEKKEVRVKSTDLGGTPIRWAVGTEKPSSVSPIRFESKGQGLTFGSVTYQWVGKDRTISSAADQTLVSLDREVFIRQGEQWKPVAENDVVALGAELEMRFRLKTRTAFEYAALESPRGAGAEPGGLLSGWRWDTLSRYEEYRDSVDRIYLPRIPQGESTVAVRIRAATAGNYWFLPARIQSAFAPDLAASSKGFMLRVGR